MKIKSLLRNIWGSSHKIIHLAKPRRARLWRFCLAWLFAFSAAPVSAQLPPPPDEPMIGLPVTAGAIIMAPEYTGCGGQYPNAVNSVYEQQVVELVNTERTSRGLPPLKRVTLLDQAARYHAVDMGQDDYFYHDSYDRQGGNLTMVCAWSARIEIFYPNRSWLGENIAWGYSTPQSVMAAWMNSSGHRSNILRAEFREIGVGYAAGNIWVEDFGRRESVYPIVINNEAAQTDNLHVNLYIYGDNTTWPEMRLRNDSLAWSNWMAFQNNLPWQLPDAIGAHTVYVPEVRHPVEDGVREIEEIHGDRDRRGGDQAPAQQGPHGAPLACPLVPPADQHRCDHERSAEGADEGRLVERGDAGADEEVGHEPEREQSRHVRRARP